jgi:hypothetical protein
MDSETGRRGRAYEPPRMIRLESARGAAGACSLMGSADDSCVQGPTAVSSCSDGAAPLIQCNDGATF